MATERTPASDKPIDDLIMNRSLIVAVLVILSALVVVGVYTYNFYQVPIGDPSDWGAFGDYIGGLINPIVGLGTVVLIWLSISLQRRELRASVAELRAANEATKLQNFESSLFAWLNTYHELIGVLRSESSVGRAAMLEWHKSRFHLNKTISTYRGNRDISFDIPKEEEVLALVRRHLELLRNSGESLSEVDWRDLVGVFDHSCKCFDSLYSAQRWQLDAVFRTLYRLLYWIDQSSIEQHRKWHYVALVRAQLSWIEMIYIFYDSLSPEGYKLALLVNKYALLDNLAASTDEMVCIYVERLKEIDKGTNEKLQKPKRVGLSIHAFDSRKAREKMGLTTLD